MSTEDRLERLLAASSAANRGKYPQAWKDQGGRVIGTVCSYVPEEIIHAAGLMPWRVLGTQRDNTPLSSAYLPATTGCSFCRHCLEAHLAKEMEFLDGVVTTHSCDNMGRMFDNWRHARPMPFGHIIHLPHRQDSFAVKGFVRALRKFKGALEKQFAVQISDEALRESIRLYNRMRVLLTRLYELRQRDNPPMTGAEALGLVTAAMVMDKAEYVAELEALLPELEKRSVDLDNRRFRLLVSGPALSDPAQLALIEEAGSIVVMDDICTSSRYFWGEVDEDGDPIEALAQRYLNRTACARMFDQTEHVDQVIAWARQYRVDGVVFFPLKFCDPWLYTFPYFSDRLQEAGIPLLNIEREFVITSVGQISTRVGAFLEMLGLVEAHT